MSDITMPKLSDSMTEGTILTWLKQDGDIVEAGDDIVEIETDKATMTYAAEASGYLTIVATEGITLSVGATIAHLGPTTAMPVVERESAVLNDPNAPGPARAVVERSRNGGETATRATPVARRIASQHGVELDGLVGSGRMGRITRADVLRKAGLAADRTPPPSPPTARPADPLAAAAAAPAITRLEPTRLQQVIARRMAEATATIPHFQVQAEVLMDTAVQLRAELTSFADADAPAPSLNDFVIKAAAIALREHPLANGSYRDGGFELHERVNVGFAVAADAALIVPTVMDAASKSLGQIASETRTLAARVRSGAITPAELALATFTVSNLGMFGMSAITPVINPPQAAILGVGALRVVLARHNGEIVDRNQMTLTLSCDHRILYGADAARLLSRIRELLEEPLRFAL